MGVTERVLWNIYHIKDVILPPLVSVVFRISVALVVGVATVALVVGVAAVALVDWVAGVAFVVGRVAFDDGVAVVAFDDGVALDDRVTFYDRVATPAAGVTDGEVHRYQQDGEDLEQEPTVYRDSHF